MIRKDSDELKKNYDSLFTSDKMKAEAFDKIAENYYLGNFGSMQKSDIDVLLFSIYIEAILEQSEDDIDKYSDYTLAKQLGITQSRISSLKVKKQLQYPYEKFDWEKSFERVCKKARYENGKIKINLRDKNLYYELRNQLDNMGSYAEATLTSNLLVISPDDFYELTANFMEKSEIEEIKQGLKQRYAGNKELCEWITKEPVGKLLKSKAGEITIDVIGEVIKEIVPGPATSFAVAALKSVCKVISDGRGSATDDAEGLVSI